MIASSHKLQLIAGDSINEQPIGLDVTLSMAFPVPDQEMVSIAFIYSESDKDSGFAIWTRGFSRFFWAASATG